MLLLRLFLLLFRLPLLLLLCLVLPGHRVLKSIHRVVHCKPLLQTCFQHCRLLRLLLRLLLLQTLRCNDRLQHQHMRR